MASITWRDETLTLKGDVKLLSRIWMPREGGPWPALLMRQPYGRQIASTVTYAHPSWWANHGFLVVIQDVRGQGDSEGKFTGFDQEIEDTGPTHKWVRSLPECNGRLGTYGFSYQGLTQLLAKEGAPAPDCLAPAMTGLDEENHWCSDGGAFWWHIGLSWGLQLAALKARKNNNLFEWEEIRRSLEDQSYLRDGPALLARHDPEGMVSKWLKLSNEKTPIWKSHKPLSTWLKQPMLLIGGWWDPHLRGILDLHQKSIDAGGQPEIHIGPASHLSWWKEAQQIQLNFFKKYLQGKNSSNNVKHNSHLWNITEKKWQQPSESSKKNESWVLKSEGNACLDPEEGLLEMNSTGQGQLHLVHDPWRPVPSIGGHLSQKPGPAERIILDNRSDIATFTSKSLEQDLHLEGWPSLHLIAKADQEGFDLCIAMSIVSQDKKKVSQLSTGVLRTTGEESMKFSPRKVLLQPICAQINEGEQLRLSISGSSWPAIGINPGRMGKQCGANGPHCEVTTILMDLSSSKFQIKPFLFK